MKNTSSISVLIPFVLIPFFFLAINQVKADDKEVSDVLKWAKNQVVANQKDNDPFSKEFRRKLNEPKIQIQTQVRKQPTQRATYIVVQEQPRFVSQPRFISQPIRRVSGGCST